MSEVIQTHYRTCSLCEAMCGIEIKHRGEEILSIKGDKDDPGASANDLTDDRFLDDLTGNAALSGVPVAIRPL